MGTIGASTLCQGKGVGCRWRPVDAPRPAGPGETTCCRCAALSRTTRWRRRPNSAGVYSGSSKSCSSSCRIQTCRPTTTPLNGASATWSSAERSAAPLDPNRAATARWHWHHSSAHGGPRASIPSPNPAACSFHLNSEQLLVQLWWEDWTAKGFEASGDIEAVCEVGSYARPGQWIHSPLEIRLEACYLYEHGSGN